MAALWFDGLPILDPVGANRGTISAVHITRNAVRQLRDLGILELVTPATVLAKYEQPIADAILRDMAAREVVDLCNPRGQTAGMQRWMLSLSVVPQDVQADQAPHHSHDHRSRRTATRLVRQQEGRSVNGWHYVSKA